MQIQSSIFNVSFYRIENIKKVFLENYQMFDGFNEPSILPIPDNGPSEIPRIVLESKNGHSQINISQDTVSLLIKYDNDYLEDWELCNKYIEKKQNVIGEFLDLISNDKLKFSGLTTTMFTDLSVDDATNFLKDRLVTSELSSTFENIFDINTRITSVVEEKYFENITFENIRVYEDQNEIMTAGFQNDQISNNVAITVDINDRYLFNTNPNYVSDKKNFPRILEISTATIDKYSNYFEK